MFNPFSYVWNTFTGVCYFVFHPRELAKAVVDPKIGAVYNVSSVFTWGSAGGLSLAYPEWARSGVTYVVTPVKNWVASDGVAYFKAAVELAKEMGGTVS